MTSERNPQARQMADESMVRNLAAQAVAIWPQEAPLFARYTLPTRARIADIGCGTGEITRRLAAHYPEAELVGVDILPGTVAHASSQGRELAPRVHFEQGDAFELAFPNAHFDLVVCRHLTQAVPRPERVLRELARICKRGGWLHVVSEDYRMLHFPDGARDPDRLWEHALPAFARAAQTDERIGRRTWGLLKALGVEQLWVDYVVVDSLRVPRSTLASILSAWRDGYTDALEASQGLPAGEVRALFDQIIATALDESQYCVWQVPVVSGRIPP